MWKKTEPATPKSNRFTCPFCGRYCIDIFYKNKRETACSYRYCPYCGEEVQPPEEKKKKQDGKHRPICLVRVLAYEVDVDMTCED